MFSRTYLVIFLAAVLLTGRAELARAASLPLLDDARGVLTIAPVLDKVTPGVVNISVKTRVAARENPLMMDPFFRRFFGAPSQPQPREAMSAGSGVIVDARNGYVLTNHHVIDNAASILVTLKDRRQFEAKLVGSDPGTDIALLQIEPDKLTDVPFGDSEDVFVGDVVIAIGNPFGIGQTVTSGIVSAVGRSGLGIDGYQDFIQTDASINPGNSGGALINSKGDLVGINTAIIGPGGGNVGIGFAVPSNMARAVMDQIVRFGEVRRGRLGVAIQDLTPDIADALGMGEITGAIVTNVETGSPAAEAGFKAGDVVVTVDGRTIRNSSDLRNQVGLVPKGERVELGIIRNGRSLEKTVEVGSVRPEALSGDEAVPELTGAVLRNIPSDHPMAGTLSGILVAAMEPGSPAWRSGLRQGDIITAVNRTQVDNLEAFRGALQKAGRAIAMNFVRNGREFFLVIQR